MALIENKSLLDFSVESDLTLSNKVILETLSNVNNINCISAFEKINTIKTMEQVTRKSDTESFKFSSTKQAVALYMESIELTKDFDAFGPFRTRNEIYWISTAFDMSGNPLYQYPNNNVQYQDYKNNIISIRAHQKHDFSKAGFPPYGFPLYPELQITGGISVQFKIFESDQELRENGYTKFISVLDDLLNKDGFSDLLRLVKPVPIIGQIQLILSMLTKYGVKLAEILKSNSDDFVDMFTINLNIDDLTAKNSWPRTMEGQGCKIVLNVK